MATTDTPIRYEIMQAAATDLPMIFELFEAAMAFQRANQYIGWEQLDKAFIRKDVQEGLLYKIVAETGILGIFSICYSDVLIWRDKEKGDALYLHRIVLNRNFEGVKIFRYLLSWAIFFTKKGQRRYIRMDTWANNSKLIQYYLGYGFKFIENYTTANTIELPEQHRNLQVALLEMDLHQYK